MKTNNLTISERIIGWVLDLYVQKFRTEKIEKPAKFHPEILAKDHW